LLEDTTTFTSGVDDLSSFIGTGAVAIEWDRVLSYLQVLDALPNAWTVEADAWGRIVVEVTYYYDDGSPAPALLQVSVVLCEAIDSNGDPVYLGDGSINPVSVHYAGASTIGSGDGRFSALVPPGSYTVDVSLGANPGYELVDCGNPGIVTTTDPTRRSGVQTVTVDEVTPVTFFVALIEDTTTPNPTTPTDTPTTTPPSTPAGNPAPTLPVGPRVNTGGEVADTGWSKGSAALLGIGAFSLTAGVLSAARFRQRHHRL
jgi:hypothetical protein